MTMIDRFPDAPARVKALPRDARGFPIPYFVSTLPGGRRDFRIADAAKMERCFTRHLCWICGQPLGTHRYFAIGPMCAVNRVTSEPPSHRDCAIFAVKVCPFLSRPMARRNERGLEDMPDLTEAAGVAITRNPGVTALWHTTEHGYQRFTVDATRGDGSRPGKLVKLKADPIDVTWWREGRPANFAEVDHSILTGLPALAAVADKQGQEAVAELARQVRRAARFMPTESPP